MATIVDPRDELAEIEARLARTRAEHSRLALAAIGRPEFHGNLDRMVREINRDTAQVEAIKNFAGSDAAASMDSAVAVADRQRKEARRRILAVYDERTEAVRLVVDLSRKLQAALPAIEEKTAEMRRLWNGQVNEPTDNRSMDRYEGIRRALAQTTIAEWKHSVGKTIGFLPEAATSQEAIRAGQDLAQFLEDEKREMLKQLQREFPGMTG